MELTEIRVYPIKSLSGVFLDNTKVNKQGIENDRLLMLVDDKGRFITQRKYPHLALINTQMNDSGITLSAPYFPNLSINSSCFLSNKISVTIWGDECSAFIANTAVNEWFSKYLGSSVRLVKYDINEPRKCDPDYSNDGDIVSFADGFPLLVISQASLDDLNSRLNNPVSMTHFRPNIIIDGCDAYSEEQWKTIKIGEIEFDAVKKCSRCILTTIDPNTGVKDKNREPLETLSKYRKTGDDIFLGMNLIPRTVGSIRMGDRIEVI